MTRSHTVIADLNTLTQVLWFDDLGSGNIQHRFLSNFYVGEPFTVPGWLNGAGDYIEWRTGEHAYAGMKATSWHDRMLIAGVAEPADAKAFGRRIKLRDDWEQVKLDVMAAVLRAKFTLHREEGRLLLATGDRYLCEGTYWHDTVWGVDLQRDDRPGRNWLGTLLMARRAELRAMGIGAKVPQTALYNAQFAGV